MAKCTRKLIDAEAAKNAIEDIHDRLCGPSAWAAKVAIHEILAALDALPDASEKAIHAERIPVPPHLAEAQRVVIARALKRQEGE